MYNQHPQQRQFIFLNHYYTTLMNMPPRFYLNPSQLPNMISNPLFIVNQQLKNPSHGFPILKSTPVIKMPILKYSQLKKMKSKPFIKFVMLLWFGSIMGYKKSYAFLYWIYNKNIDGIQDDSLKYISEYYYVNKIFPAGLVYHPVFPSFNIREPIKEMSIEDEKKHDAIIREVLQNIISNPHENSMTSHIVAESLINMFL